MVSYAELHCLSNFSFQRGASHPEELVARAAELGYAALAITDECSLAGVVRAHVEAKRRGLPLIVGAEFRLRDGFRLVLLATDRESYGRLSTLITHARRGARKGGYQLDRAALEAHCPHGCVALWLPDFVSRTNDGLWLARLFPRKTWIAVELFLSGNDRERLQQLRALNQACKLPLCACGDVHMHDRKRRPLQDTLTAIRLGKPLTELGLALYPNGEHHLRSGTRLARLYPQDLLSETMNIARLCRFSLDELRYEYPCELVPAGYNPQAWLKHLAEQGLLRRYPQGAPTSVRQMLERELALVRELAYESYFLTVHDIVQFAHTQEILCQGRGSAANSVLCYCLGITEVNPERIDLLFERFISKERNEPPDIDVDFEHERREEVIQYIYRKYGRERAALAATVITYRPRSAIRDVGKALGLDPDRIDQLAKSIQWWDGQCLSPEQIADTGLDPDSPVVMHLVSLVNSLIGFPRHLSQHTGGFVIAANALSRLVPIENAAMPERTVIQWDKDDLEALGLLKVDVLALGMLTAIRKTLTYVREQTGRAWTMATIPEGDEQVYAMLQKADSVGVFQIESRAQMSMLPRLKPKNYYDLVVQIAIVRPGPIQGNMVHPYLARRDDPSLVDYPGDEVKAVLQRTLGVPIFQEQVMKLAVVAAGFTPGEADELRRSMAAWRRKGGLEKFEQKLMLGMRERGYAEAFARRIFQQIQGFGEYGFPESHSASFALLAYVSAWLKHYYPAAFTCALLNSQPMGFYAPSQLVQDARRHGVEVRPVDVRYSDADCSLEGKSPQPPLAKGGLSDSPFFEKGRLLSKGEVHGDFFFALRLGLRMVKGLSTAGIEVLLAARRTAPFEDVQDLTTRAVLNKKDLKNLAAADALQGLAGHRHRAWWQVGGAEKPLPIFPNPRFVEPEALLRKPIEAEDIGADYASLGLSLRRHPLALLRERLAALGIRRASELGSVRNGAIAKAAGLVINRQRPGSGEIIFITLEDESGHVNVIVRPPIAAAQRAPLLESRLLMVSGVVQQEHNVLHLIAGKLKDLSAWLGRLATPSRDFH
ncbi:MAG: error-prone DNA polymerase [Gammaproteobacteria bacterium]|nr:error-prone DNA polymerase [Gammaproteobacteria bacterium]